MGHVGEPSVEEILASIKKVIARDNRAEAQYRADATMSRTDASISRADAGQTRARADSAQRVPPRQAEVLELTEAADEPDDFADTEGLIAGAATASMRESLAALSMLSQPGVAPQIVRSGETSLEGLVREMLRPMLANWLEVNLPAMVEKMVSAEIARIAGKRG